MTERPILFSALMVRALLDGTTTQTRRVVKGRGWEPHHLNQQRLVQHTDPRAGLQAYFRGDGIGDWMGIACPYGQPGDRLWVREAWRAELTWDTTKPSEISDEAALWYEADDQQRNNGRGAKFKGKLRPGMFMPRWASRITLEITSVRVERLQDISEADANAEGVVWEQGQTAVNVFETLWEQLNGPESWVANPWVWVVEFTRTK